MDGGSAHEPGMSSKSRRSRSSLMMTCSSGVGIMGAGPGYPFGNKRFLAEMMIPVRREGVRRWVYNRWRNNLICDPVVDNKQGRKDK